jgi:hypothetical protein
MWRQIKSAAVAATILAVSAGMAWAQGSVTQDPGSLTPGNLTFQDLGPAGPTPGPTGQRSVVESPGAYSRSGTTGPIIGPGTSSTGFGAGNNRGFGSNATGAGR